ncbi:ATP16 [Auxenochlorella protothecoides x Auxenochlorella symbiontica]
MPRGGSPQRELQHCCLPGAECQRTEQEGRAQGFKITGDPRKLGFAQCHRTQGPLHPSALPPPVPNSQEFLSKFAAFQGTMNEPEFPSNFVKPVEKAENASVPDKLKFNFYIPSAAINQGSSVDLVLLPATTGDFGVMPGHVPTVAELRPGVVSVHNELDKDVTKYFVSGGFAFIHADSTTDVCAVEAVPLSDIDSDAVRAGLAEYTGKLASLQGKGDDYELAAAQAGVEVYSALNSALGL